MAREFRLWPLQPQFPDAHQTGCESLRLTEVEMTSFLSARFTSSKGTLSHSYNANKHWHFNIELWLCVWRGGYKSLSSFQSASQCADFIQHYRDGV